MINVRMQHSEVQKLSPKITVIGVGGAGGNAIKDMIGSGLQGVEFLVCNTDAQALELSPCENKVQLGVTVTQGLGAGAKPEIGRSAAEESLDDVMQYLADSNMVFITAGMGGGTGTGAAPIIAKACREKGILTVGVVTKPFHFEGALRMTMAEDGIKAMQDYVDTLIVIPNQNLFRVANEKTTFAEAFKMADSVLQSGVRGVTDLMVMPGMINLDFADIRSAMLEMGKAMMGTGESSGDKRPIEAAEAAINNPLLDDVTMKGARGVIINITGGPDMTLFEVDEACNRIRDEVDPHANIIFGSTFDENMEGAMRVSIVATGIDAQAAQGGLSASYIAEKKFERAQPITEPAASEERFENVAPVAQAPVAQPQTPPSRQPAAQYQIPTAPATNETEFTAQPAAPVQTAQPSIQEEPESEMFAEQRYTDTPHMRGSVQGNSFIPPKPMEASQIKEETSFSSPSITEAAPAEDVQASQPGSHLKPPVPGGQQPKKRTPSLFERFTGPKAEETNESVTAQRPAASEGGFHSGLRATKSPSQGSLDIEARKAAETGAEGEDELDIPAFLRRQAN